LKNTLKKGKPFTPGVILDPNVVHRSLGYLGQLFTEREKEILVFQVALK